jgi:hypothetical protein
MTRKIILGKKCVCDIEGKKNGHKLNFDYCNGKWFMDIHVFLLVFGSI